MKHFLKKLLVFSMAAVIAVPASFAASYTNVQRAKAASSDPRTVVINEINWGGSSTAPEDEWIELFNTTDSAIDLSGWQIKHASSSSSHNLVIPAGKTIAASGYFLITKFDKSASNCNLSVDSDWAAPSITLSNDEDDDLYLKDASSVVIDSAKTWASGDYDLRGASRHYYSMARKNQGGDGMTSSNWFVSDFARGLKSNLVDLGTPGTSNAPIITIGSYDTDPAKSVTVTATTDHGVLASGSMTITANGTYSFVVTNSNGLPASKSFTISNIEKDLPVITSISDITAGEEFSLDIEATDATLPLTYSLSRIYGPGDLTFTQDATDPSIFKIKANVNGVYTVVATVTDAAGNYTTTRFHFTWNAEYNITPENPVLKINRATGDGEIIIDPTVENPVLDLSSFLTTSGDPLDDPAEQFVLLQDLTYKIKTVVNNEPVIMTFGFRDSLVGDSNLEIHGPAGWDGKINLPKLADVSSVVLPVAAENRATDIVAIETGLAEGSLRFVGPISLTFSGAADKKAGFVKDGEFVEVNNQCDMAELANSVDPSECKAISEDGNDLIIWTNHLTQFVTYSEVESTVVPVPEFTVTTSTVDGVKYIHFAWTGNGSDEYKIFVNGVLVDTVTGNEADTTVKYTKDIKVLDDGTYNLYMTAAVNGIDSEPTAIKTVTFTTVVTETVAPQETATPIISVSRAKAATQPAESKVQTPSDDNGIIKGEEAPKTEETSVNWTPWIVLFILIILAGAATGGYFYWFAGKDEESEEQPAKETKAPKVEKPKTEEVKPEAVVTVRDKSNKKKKRW